MRTAGLTVVLALLSPAAAAAPVRVAEFVSSCSFSHRAAVDPIVAPGRPVSDHSHDFFGNRRTGARSTPRGLRRAPTSCSPRGDRSAYWVPTLYRGGRALRAAQATFYYVSSHRDPGAVRPFPRDLRVVAGDASARRPARVKVAEWSCPGSGLASEQEIPLCPAGTRLELNLRFPDCWDGRRSDSPDHMRHMAYAAAGRCPRSHPVAVPELKVKLRYPTRGGPDVVLSSGPGHTLHGDFMNGWDERALRRRIAACLHAVVKCGASGRPLR